MLAILMKSLIDTVSWDAMIYADQLPRHAVHTTSLEDELLYRFPPLAPAGEVTGLEDTLPIVSKPAVFCDSAGRILAWSLPRILSERHQVSGYAI